MDHSFTQLLPALAALLFSARALGLVAQRIGQPSVLGEILAGILLGTSGLRILDPANPAIHALAEMGVVILLFEIGLHTDIRSLARTGGSALAVAIAGVVLPFAGGYWVATMLGVDTLPAIVCGAALTATSIGISARVLSDLGCLTTPEGQIVLGAAVIDDVVGLVILTVVSSMAAGAAVTFGGIAGTSALALGFIAVTLAIGSIVIPPALRWVDRLEASGTLGVAGITLAFAFAWLADITGSAVIIGAFAAGLLVNRTPQRASIERSTTALGHFFVPIFFASIGAQIDLRALLDIEALSLGGALIAVGILGKFLAGYAPFTFRGNKALIGVSMIPRGEVGLIFAQTGLATGILSSSHFSSVTIMVIVTTLITPIVLGRMAGGVAPGGQCDPAGSGGIDDLVAGSDTQAYPINLSLPSSPGKESADRPR